jgi:dTDP-4-dehydrorhamnose reductase
MRILITGANGMLGRELAPVLAPRHEVRAVSHAECDIADESSIRHAVAEWTPELAINCAALSDVDGCERAPERAQAVNAHGAGHMARAAERIGARVFHISTDYVFDGEKHTPYTEQDVPNPLSRYGRSKLEGERLVLGEGVQPSPHLVIRTSWLYGRYRTNFVDKAVENARVGKRISAVTEQVSCPTWTLHLAEKIAALVETRASGILHLAGSGACSRYEMARYLVSKLGCSAEVLATTWAQINPPARRPVYTAMISTRLATLGLTPLPDWKEALTAYLSLRYAGPS